MHCPLSSCAKIVAQKKKKKKPWRLWDIFETISHCRLEKKQKNKTELSWYKSACEPFFFFFFSLNEQQEDPNSFPSSSSNWSERPRRAGGQHESDFAAVSSVCRSASLRPDHDPTCPTHVGGRRRPGSVRYASPDIPCVTSSVRPNFFFFFFPPSSACLCEMVLRLPWQEICFHGGSSESLCASR